MDLGTAERPGAGEGQTVGIDATTLEANAAMRSIAVLAVTLQEADQGDTTTVIETLAQAGENAAEMMGTEATNQKPQMHLQGVEEVVTDKGYHSGWVLAEMKSAEVRTYIPEKKQPGRRRANFRYGAVTSAARLDAASCQVLIHCRINLASFMRALLVVGVDANDQNLLQTDALL